MKKAAGDVSRRLAFVEEIENKLPFALRGCPAAFRRPWLLAALQQRRPARSHRRNRSTARRLQHLTSLHRPFSSLKCKADATAKGLTRQYAPEAACHLLHIRN